MESDVTFEGRDPGSGPTKTTPGSPKRRRSIDFDAFETFRESPGRFDRLPGLGTPSGIPTSTARLLAARRSNREPIVAFEAPPRATPFPRVSVPETHFRARDGRSSPGPRDSMDLDVTFEGGPGSAPPERRWTFRKSTEGSVSKPSKRFARFGGLSGASGAASQRTDPKSMDFDVTFGSRDPGSGPAGTTTGSPKRRPKVELVASDALRSSPERFESVRRRTMPS